MAVRIRLKKMGRRHRPFFRLCAMDGRTPRDGRVIEELGIYDPMIRETDARAILKGERIDYWIGVGAKPTPKVAVLIKKYGTDGSHLDQQQQALNRLAERKANAISGAASDAQKVAARKPKEEPKPAEDAAAETAADEETAETEAPVSETPAEEKTEIKTETTDAKSSDSE